METRFDMLEAMGSAPLGTIWRATDTLTNREVVVKRIPLEHIGGATKGNGWDALVDQTRRLTRLDHPSVAHVLEVVERLGHLDVAVEPTSGTDLATASLAADGERILGWLVQILEALALAHSAGVVHRHLHEDLVVVADDGRAVIEGFALALTRKVDQLKLPPELLQGDGAGEATDQFLAAAMIRRIIDHLDPSPTLTAVIERAMAEDPAERYPDILDFSDALRAAWTTGGEQLAERGDGPPVEDTFHRDPVIADESVPSPSTVERAVVTIEEVGETRSGGSGRSLLIAVVAAAVIVVSLVSWWILDSRPAAVAPGGGVEVARQVAPVSAMDDVAAALEHGDTEQAVTLLRAMAENPDSPERVAALNTLGTIHLQSGRPQEAVAAFGDALKLEAGEELYFKMVLAQAASGDDEAARRTLGEALNLYPESRRLDEAGRHLGGV